MQENVVSRYTELLKELLARPRYSVPEVSPDIPKAPGVYVIYDKRMDAIIYVGRTKNLRRRLLGEHMRGNVRGSHFRKALGRNFILNSEDKIDGIF